VADEHPHLAQEWVHSHEEDQGGSIVFRPPSFNFPLSRGRQSLNLKRDGSLTEGAPGPTDRSQSSKGTWKVEGQTLTLKKPGQADRRYEIAASAADKLVLTEKA
jgi:hypothetical protein